MSTRQHYLEFAPPPTPGLLRGVVLAIVAHSVLLAILAMGVQWKRDAPLVTAEAELWSTLPQEAAPPAPPPEPPAPEPEPPKVAPPKPEPVVAPPQPDPSIAIEREKAKKLKERELLEKEKKLQEKKLAEKAAADKLEKAKAQKAKEIDEAKKAQAAKDAKAKPAQSAADLKKLADLRAQNLKRMAGLAGTASGTGSETSQGTAAQSSGPSAGYAGRIRARIKPNITFTETLSGNPLADVEVRTSPDGTIISRRIVQSSGVKAWDEAVLSAIDKTETLPRDVDGRVPPVLIIGFKPRD